MTVHKLDGLFVEAHIQVAIHYIKSSFGFSGITPLNGNILSEEFLFNPCEAIDAKPAVAESGGANAKKPVIIALTYDTALS